MLLASTENPRNTFQRFRQTDKRSPLEEITESNDINK